MMRRLVLARALINDPELLILDEPTTGLDPQARHQVWHRLDELKGRGLTILLTTHYMEEAARLCDRLVIMDHGRILVEGRPHELVQAHVGREVIEILAPEEPLREYVRQQGLEHEDLGHRLIIYSGESDALYHRLVDTYCREGCTLRQATLEDVFLRLTGREFTPNRRVPRQRSLGVSCASGSATCSVYRRTWKINSAAAARASPFLPARSGWGWRCWSARQLPRRSLLRCLHRPGLIAVNIMDSAFFENTYASFVRMYYQEPSMPCWRPVLPEIISGRSSGGYKSVIGTAIMMTVISAFGSCTIRTPCCCCRSPSLAASPSAPSACSSHRLFPTSRPFNLPVFLFVTDVSQRHVFPLENLPPWAQSWPRSPLTTWSTSRA
jgi:hypothetical protein